MSSRTARALALATALLAGTVGLAPAALAGETRPQPTAPAAPGTSLADVARLVGADRLWAKGVTGRGVDVALIDSGVVPVPGLAAAGKVVHGADLSFDSQTPAARLDGFGHGTHLAGLIAADGNGRRGIAPGSRLVNVKVGSSDGAVDVSQMIAALDWVVEHRRDAGLDIRVVNLSLGTDSAQPADVDPLAKAVDNAWRAGIVVVVAVGNDGRTDSRVASPASNPNVLAVGATDSVGSTDPARSRVADFSAAGRTRKPDLLAPGARILSLRAPGSVLDEAFPAARSGALFRGSGTSQSAAVVSGAVALLLQARPELTPDQVKALLLRTAAPVAGGVRVVGRTQLDVAAAAAAPVPATVQRLTPLSGTGSLEQARGSVRVEDDGVALTGERDIFGAPFDSASWAHLSTAGTAWVDGTWNGSTWTGGAWTAPVADGGAWSGHSWSGHSWSGHSWSGHSWSGHSWSGHSWSGHSWSGHSWSGHSWSGHSWSGHSWSGHSWSGHSWSGDSWA